jgi:HAMP domain-containing protein
MGKLPAKGSPKKKIDKDVSRSGDSAKLRTTPKNKKEVEKPLSGKTKNSKTKKGTKKSKSVSKKETSRTSMKAVKSHSKDEDIGDEDIVAPKSRGLSLGAKLGITITLVSAVLTLVVGFAIALQTSSLISEEIKRSGIDSVKFLRSQAKELILNHYDGQEKNVLEFKRKVQNILAETKLASLSKEEYGQKTTILDGYITVSEVNGGSPDKIFSLMENSTGDTGDTVITPKSGGLIYPLGSDLKSNLKIYKATLERDNTRFEVFSFELAMKFEVTNIHQSSNFRPETGKVFLFLSTEKVAESEATVFKMTAVILAISVLISILVAYFLSRSITKPILLLVKDMTIVQRGNLDHVTKANSSDEVGYLSSTFNSLTKSLKTAHEAEIVKEKLQHDLEIGKEIQKNLLPSDNLRIKGYDSACYYESAKEVGGDYYDLISISKKNRKLGVVVADVSGKGIQGAMVMTVMRTIMNIAANSAKSSFECLCRTNKFLTPKIKRGMFVTTFYVVLDYAEHKLSFCSAGHNPMIIYRAKTKTIELFNPTGIALGFDKGPLFERTLKEGEASLEKGDRFVLYTDGVVESMNEDREEYTDPRFHNFVLKYAEVDSKSFVQKLVAELKRHQGNAEQHDDITIVTFKKKS